LGRYFGVKAGPASFTAL